MIEPKEIAVKYSPPMLCLIYTSPSGSYFHNFEVGDELIQQSSQKIYQNLMSTHPGYLDDIEPRQVISLIDKLKLNQRQTKSQKSRNQAQNVKDLNRAINDADLFPDDLVKISQKFDFDAIDRHIELSDSGSDISF